jgi:hypothetical protein
MRLLFLIRQVIKDLKGAKPYAGRTPEESQKLSEELLRDLKQDPNFIPKDDFVKS